ncbi:MAG: hypothetical protein GKS03_06020 [Alphaproteobacteria bacterium]|nr:hypothetical protein [Alphaproteobacteria bacterium]
MSRLVRTEHIYEVDADRLWGSCVSYDCLAESMASLLSYQGLPEGELEAGQCLEVSLTHFRIVPPVSWWIDVIERDDSRRVLRTSERGGSIKSYLHTLTVEDMGHGVSRLIDNVEFDAGWLSGVMSMWIQHIYESRDKPRRRLLGLAP